MALFDQGKALTAIVVQNVSAKGDTVTVTTEKDPSIQELYQYIKVDIEETANSFRKEADPYLAYNPTNAIGGAVLRCASDWRKDLKRDIAANPTVSSKLEQSVELSLGNNTKLEVKTDLTMKYALSLEYDFSWLQNTVDFEVTSEISGDVSAKVGVEKKFDSTKNTVETFQLTVKDIDAKLGKYWIPTSLPGVSFTAELSVPVKLNVNSNMEIKQKISMTNGVGVHWKNGKVTYNTIQDKQNERILDWKGEGSISVGAKAAVGVDALSVVSGELSGEIGAKAKAGWTKTVWTGNEPESKHLCEKCLSGDVKGYAKAGVKVKLGIKGTALSTTLVDLTIAEAEFLKRDFYVSVDKFIADDADYMGWNAKCPNMAYLTKILTKDTTGKELDDVSVSICPTNETQTEKQDATGGESVYLYKGSYSAMAQGTDGKTYSKEFTVSGKAQEVTVELPAEQLSNTSEVVVDLYTGMPQIRYYNDKGQVIFIISMNVGWDGGSRYDDPVGHLQCAFAVAFSYDAAGKLMHSTATEIHDSAELSDFSPRNIFEGDLTYRYEGELVNAYGNDGKLRFSLDKHGNIVEEHNYHPFFPETFGYDLIRVNYTYDDHGKVTSVRKDHEGNDRERFDAKVSYDANGNLTVYEKTRHVEEADGTITPETWVQEYHYENGLMTRFDDSDYSVWPWLFSYDSNGQVTELYIEDMDDGSHSGNYVAMEEFMVFLNGYGWRSKYILRDYHFSTVTENGMIKLLIRFYVGYNNGTNKEKTIIVPAIKYNAAK